MALGLTYEQGAAKAGAAFMNVLESRGCDRLLENALLKALGLKVEEDYVQRIFSAHWCSLGFAKNMLWGRRAMVTVRSKNNRDGTHMVYWDGQTMFDPCTREVYGSWEEVEPMEAVIFNEVHHA